MGYVLKDTVNVPHYSNLQIINFHWPHSACEATLQIRIPVENYQRFARIYHGVELWYQWVLYYNFNTNFRHSLEDALERAFRPALAAVIAFIDPQGNLNQLNSSAGKIQQLWVDIFRLCDTLGLSFDHITKVSAGSSPSSVCNVFLSLTHSITRYSSRQSSTGIETALLSLVKRSLFVETAKI